VDGAHHYQAREWDGHLLHQQQRAGELRASAYE
jgi:hypothetical protein